MNEMLMAARAMRSHGVKMSHCAEQISEHFLDLLRKAEANAAEGGADAAGATSEPAEPREAEAGEAGEAGEAVKAGEEHPEAQAPEGPGDVASVALVFARCCRKPQSLTTRMPCFLHLPWSC